MSKPSDSEGKPKREKRRYKALLIEYHQLYLFLLPAIAFYILFSYIPMYGVSLAFREYRFDKGLFFSPIANPWYKYFRSFYNYYNSWGIIRNTLVINFFKIILYFPMPIIFALMLNEVRSNRFKRAIQTVSYLPHFMSWVIAYVLIYQFLALDTGIFNEVRALWGQPKIFFTNDIQYFYPVMFISHIWKNIGFSAIIYLAALAGVDPELHEAATIDGAGRFRRMWHISLPSIRYTVAMLFILGLSQALSAGWDQIYLLRTPGNMRIADILDTYVIQVGLKEGQFGYASAVDLFKSVIGLTLIFITNSIVKKMTDKEIALF
ncbi:MAG: ABC transporter permease subunit [Defluviitaleaceae bacterium]|nr:ABC transporter permease subunit [Defluviitaleaceae bacterium]